MSQSAAGRRVAAVMAAAALCFCQSPARAQETDPLRELDQPLDPSAPLDPLPDLGVPWPDMDSEAQNAATPDPIIADAGAERSYTIVLEGLDEATSSALAARFNSLSVLEANRDDPANAAQLDRRARQDADLLAELLRASGYYDAAVATRVEGAESGAARVVLETRPGPLYRFAEVSLPGLDAAGPERAALEQAFGVAAGAPVDAAAVTAGEAALRAELGRRGFAFADVGALDVTVDHEARTARLVLPVQPNGARQFGRIMVEGRPLFSAEHIQTIARFEPGERFQAPRLDDLRRALVATGLVSTVDIRPVARPGGGDIVDIAVGLEPAPMRTVAGEFGYGTGEGARVELSWEHRNLLPPEGAVRFRGVLGTEEQLIGATLRRNNFGRRDRVLTANVVASNIDRDAYNARTFLIGGGIERQTNIIWQKRWTWSIGADLIASDERDVNIDLGMSRRRTFFIAALPGTLSYDGSNDLLDPTRGYRLAGRISPELSLQSGTFGYTRAQIDGSFYQPVSDTVTLAARARLGTIFGADRDRIAPSRRFYAGGGGSVRGYGFQRLGPRDPVFDDPIGGRSLTEFALEARVRVGGPFGVVPFIDAGNIYTSPLPKLDDLRFGVGVGVRYHSNFGPIRVDVGTPLNRRSGDPRVAVYVSLGQAF